jgi:heme/copper-type cytochrome/quinol oxidase subunit 2
MHIGRINWLLGFNVFVCVMAFFTLLNASFFTKDEKVSLILGIGIWGVFALIVVTVVMVIGMNLYLCSEQREGAGTSSCEEKVMGKIVALLIPNSLVCCVFFLGTVYYVVVFESSADTFLWLEAFGLYMLIASNMITLRRICMDKRRLRSGEKR